MDEAGPGTPGSGDSCYICTVPDSVGRVPAAATGDPAAVVAAAGLGSIVAAAGHASAADTHAAAAPWLYAACSDSHWGSTATTSALAWSDCYYFDDSSITAQWASELGTTTSTVCFTYRAGLLVVCFARVSPVVHTTPDGLHTGTDVVAA